PTLFPYTTLFRSYRCTLISPQGRELRVVGGGEAVAPVVEGDELLAKNEFLVNNLWMIALAKSQALSGEELADKNKNEVVDNALEDARDRKSTRLNSSHV